MKYQSKWVLLISTVLVLLIVLSACRSADTPEEQAQVSPTAGSTQQGIELTPAPSATPVFSLPDQSSLPTVKPYVLEGATITESGLQYLELQAGDGRTPKTGDLLTMHFTGSLPDGSVFTNTSADQDPITALYGREQLLPGWEEGLGLMKAGGRARMVLPPELAFGEQGYGMIPPNSQIILEVELLSVEKPPQPTSVSEDQLTTSESGLKYADLTEGKGDLAELSSIVSTHFTIWVQGEQEAEYVFSSQGNDPLTFVVGRGGTVFEGWDQGVRDMKVGGKRLLVIPPELAFGEAGGNGIPPDATLVMEIELVDLRQPVEMTEVDEQDYQTTDSGLKYYDIVEGDGEMPETGQTVVVHYTGWLEDGQQFDSSLDRGTPFTFTLGQGGVIPGWDEGVATMKVGGKRQLVIPSELGYGDQGAGGVIPPGATLIFDIELIDIQP